jgi:hypothetical protein
MQSFPVVGRYRQENSATLAFLAPASACHPINNDHKASSFHSIIILVLFSNQIFLCLKKLNLFLDFRKKSHLM